MREYSFRRAALFGVLGALIFFIIGLMLCSIFSSLNNFWLFKTQELMKADLKILAITVRFNPFVVIGFILGWAYCLFRGTSWRRQPRRDEKSSRES